MGNGADSYLKIIFRDALNEADICESFEEEESWRDGFLGLMLSGIEGE
jgi:hypothetical protein